MKKESNVDEILREGAPGCKAPKSILHEVPFGVVHRNLVGCIGFTRYSDRTYLCSNRAEAFCLIRVEPRSLLRLLNETKLFFLKKIKLGGIKNEIYEKFYV